MYVWMLRRQLKWYSCHDHEIHTHTHTHVLSCSRHQSGNICMCSLQARFSVSFNAIIYARYRYTVNTVCWGQLVPGHCHNAALLRPINTLFVFCRFAFGNHTHTWIKIKTFFAPYSSEIRKKQGSCNSFCVQIFFTSSKRWYYLAAHRQIVNVLTSDIAFLIFAVLVVWCRHCRPYNPF